MTGHQERAARIIQVTLPPDPEALVLVLHGGAARRGAMMVSPAQLSVLRMIPVARAIGRAGRGRQPDVASVVALAPWVYPTDFADATGRQVLIVHGSSDRVASPQRSATVARAMGERAAVGYVLIDGGRHAMLRHHRQFTSLAADFTTAALLET